MNDPALLLADSVSVIADTVTPGVLGFIVIALIGGALFLLMRSMRRHLNAVRSPDFDARVAAHTDSEDERRTR